MVSGSKIPLENHKFIGGPIQRNPISKEEFPLIEKEIQRLERMKVIEKSKHEEGEIISPIFSVSKTDGTSRIILNLKKIQSICGI